MVPEAAAEAAARVKTAQAHMTEVMESLVELMRIDDEEISTDALTAEAITSDVVLDKTITMEPTKMVVLKEEMSQAKRVRMKMVGMSPKWVVMSKVAKSPKAMTGHVDDHTDHLEEEADITTEIDVVTAAAIGNHSSNNHNKRRRGNHKINDVILILLTQKNKPLLN